MSFLHRLPVINTNSCFMGKPAVHYVDFYKRTPFEVCSVNGAEIPLKYFKASSDKRENLSEFLKRREVPLSWGLHTDSQILIRSPRVFEGLMLGLSEITDEHYGMFNEPAIKKAVSWPLTFPSHVFFTLAVKKSELGEWLHSSMWATQMLRVGMTESLEEAIPKVRKRIISKANDMGLDTRIFSGENMIMEIAHIQCLRMIYASRIERERACNHSKVYTLLRSFDTFSVVSDLSFDQNIADSIPLTPEQCTDDTQVESVIERMNNFLRL
ncbi:nonstructural protein [Bujaru virus]|uniref:NSs n=1 Tax=Bujaru virus TaxID=904679 RepID=A0A1S5SHV3_9VIRU|nr:nonstructural protein [Bujaru virus]API68882.1 nonstructural protein [Bujaru virus]QLA46866.1 NSs [Bujaru virus]